MTLRDDMIRLMALQQADTHIQDAINAILPAYGHIRGAHDDGDYLHDLGSVLDALEGLREALTKEIESLMEGKP